jgi:hypothetical protein
VEAHRDRVHPVLLGQPSVDWRTGANEVYHRHSADVALEVAEPASPRRAARAS